MAHFNFSIYKCRQGAGVFETRISEHPDTFSTMKAILALLFVSLPALAAGDGFLDDFCGEQVTLYGETDSRVFTIRSNSAFTSQCVVHLYAKEYRRVQLVITGDSLDPQGCSVSVSTYDMSGTGSDIESFGYFTRTKWSNNMGSLYLYVQGPRCADSSYNLQFTATTVCPSGYYFKCDSGQCVGSYDVCDGYDDCDDGSDERDCFWTTGTYVGVAVGAVFFVALVASISTFCYRRRVLYVQSSPMMIPSNQAVVTPNMASGSAPVVHSKW